MLKQLRKKTKVIMVIVVLFFIGMIVFQWGMDIGGKQSMGQKSGFIGEINGVKIKYEQYDALVRQQQETLNQNQRMTNEQSRKLYDDAWDYVVTNTLIEQEIKKRGITYTDKELFDYMLKNPSQMVYQVPQFQTDNRFDITKYQAFLNNPDNLSNPQSRQFLDYVEFEAKRTLPIMKLSQTLENGVIVKETEIREQWLRENEERKIAWFFVTTSSIQSYPDSVNTDAVRKYYEEHIDDYKHEEMRGLETVYFRLAPTPEDSMEVLNQAKLIYERAQKGDSFAELADTYTEDPGNENQGTKHGGDLGFFGKGAMAKEFEQVAFSLKPGEISAPFLSRFGYHIVKVDSVTYKDSEKNSDSTKKGKKPVKPAEQEIDQVKARHILLKIEPSGITQDLVEKKVTAFHEAVQGGMDFNIKAQADSLQVIRLPLLTKNTTSIPNVGRNVQMLVNRLFKAKKGDVLPVFTTDNGSFIFRVSEIKEAGTASFEESEQRVVEEYKRKMRGEYLEKYCTVVYDAMKKGLGLADAVQAVPDPLVSAKVDTTQVTRTYFVPGLGELNPFIAKVFTLGNAGDCTGPLLTDNGCGLAVLLEKPPLDDSKYESDKAAIKTRLENDLKNEVMSRFLEELKKNAKIVDNRDDFINM